MGPLASEARPIRHHCFYDVISLRRVVEDILTWIGGVADSGRRDDRSRMSSHRAGAILLALKLRQKQATKSGAFS